MSERLTDERWATLNDPEGGAWTDEDANAVAAEAKRARAEEARLLELVKEKDAQIRALADALEVAQRRLRRPSDLTFSDAQQIVDALRLCGRL